jgi:hypothetical protein
VHLFEQEHDILSYVQDLGVPMPKLFLSLSEFVLNMELKDALAKDPADTVKAGDILADLNSIQAKLDAAGAEKLLTKKLAAFTDSFAADIYQTERAAKLVNFLSFTEMLSLPVKLYRAQNIVFGKVGEMPKNLRENPLIKTLCKKLNLNLNS